MIPKPPINVLHYVGGVSTAKDSAVYLNRDSNLGWSAHYFVDECEIWQSVDFDHATGAQDVYNTGDWVHYSTAEDKIWISTSDNNVWQPGVYGWEIYKEN